jgi:tryptophan synthase alpha subunit
LRRQVAQVSKTTSLPVGVGFGISTPKQAAWIAEFADAAVVGSALVQRIEQGKKQICQGEASRGIRSPTKTGDEAGPQKNLIAKMPMMRL